MIFRFIFFVILIVNNSLYCQNGYKIYYQQKEDTITLLMDNLDPFPYSIEFEGNPKVENMRAIGELFKNKMVLDALASKIRLAQFVPLDNKKPFSFKQMPSFMSYIGNIWKTDYDEDYAYDLPYPKKQTFQLIQGYNGNYSHSNQNALDFKMPEGTEILAARDGFVTQVKFDSKTGCASKECANQGNFVRIIHSDGTFAEYYHLLFNSSKIKVGDKVDKGQAIALSGNTGFSNGPHLHFMVYLPTNKKIQRKNTLKTKFITKKKGEVTFLKSGNYY